LPITTGFVEEMTCRGYAQPRLQALSGKAWIAILIMAFGFGMQHIVFSMVDWRSALARFISMFLCGLLFGFIYLRLKRLVPLIFAHWLLNLLGLGLLPLLAVLSTS
jgi:membrane protease YdiL (CAAX protease family)